jgi:hypothetical protein
LQEALAEVRGDIERQELEAVLSESKGLLNAGQLDEAADKLRRHQARFPGAGELRALSSYANELLKARERVDEIDEAARNTQRLLDQQKLEEAAALVAAAAAKYPDEVRLASLLEKANRAIADRQQREAVQQIVREAEVLLQKRKYAEALSVLDKGLQRYPNEGALSEAKSAALSAQKRAEIERLLEDARSRAAMHQFADAIRALERGLERFPDQPEIAAAAETVRAEFAEHERRHAVASAVRASETALSKNQPERALEIVASALARLPDEPNLLRMRELAEGRLHRLQLARKRKDELEQLRGLARAVGDVAEPAKLDEIWAIASGLLASYENDAEFQEAASRLRRVIDARASNLNARASAEFEVPGSVASAESASIATAVPQRAVSKRRLAYAGAGIAGVLAIAAAIFIVTQQKPSEPSAPIVTEPIPQPAPALAKIVQFYASEPVIRPGESVQLCYSVLNARSVRLDPAVAQVEALPNHCLELKPSATAEYKLTAVGGDGTETSETVRVVVQDAPAAIGMLLVQTQLDGVAVLINGRRHGRLTESGEVRIPLDAKEYVIGVEKTGFESPEARRVRLAKDTTQGSNSVCSPSPQCSRLRELQQGSRWRLTGSLSVYSKATGSSKSRQELM